MGSSRFVVRTILTTLGPRLVRLEVCATTEERARGYRGRAPPQSDDEGMLFVNVLSPRFTMKGVPFPLDVLFFDADGACVGNLTLPAMDERLFGCSHPVRCAIELRAGWAARNGPHLYLAP